MRHAPARHTDAESTRTADPSRNPRPAAPIVITLLLLIALGVVLVVLGRVPVEVAYQVFIRDGDRELPFGRFTSGVARLVPGEVGADDPLALMGSAQDSLDRMVRAEVPAIKGRTVEVILRPDPDFAARTVDLQSIYGGELRYPDVRVRRWPARR